MANVSLAIRFMFTLSKVTPHMIRGHASPFLNMATIVRLAPWTQAETEDFANKVVGSIAAMTRDAHATIFALSGGHPYLTKAILRELLRTPAPTISAYEVAQAESACRETPEVCLTLQNLLQVHFTEGERRVLRHLAGAPAPVKGTALNAATRDVLSLVGRDYLREVRSGYELSYGLLGRWLKSRPREFFQNSYSPESPGYGGAVLRTKGREPMRGAAAATRLEGETGLSDVEASSPFEMMTNPYVFGVPVTAHREFFGRRGELGMLLSHVADRGPQSVVIRGPRRVGKSSLLRAVETVLRDADRRLGARDWFAVPPAWDDALNATTPVMINLQAQLGIRPEAPTAAEFYRAALSALHASGLGTDLSEVAAREPSLTYRQFEGALRDILATLPERRVLMMIRRIRHDGEYGRPFVILWSPASWHRGAARDYMGHRQRVGAPR